MIVLELFHLKNKGLCFRALRCHQGNNSPGDKINMQFLTPTRINFDIGSSPIRHVKMNANLTVRYIC